MLRCKCREHEASSALPQEVHSDHFTCHHRDTRKHHISMEELEAKLGIRDSDIRHYVHSRVLRYLGHVFRMDADRTPSPLQRCLPVVVARVVARDGRHCQALPWASLQVVVKSRSLTILLYRSCLARSRWGSASLMPLTRATGQRRSLLLKTRTESSKFPPSCHQTAGPGPLLSPKGLHRPHYEQLAPRRVA
jgi:hypothetical protein